MPDWMAHWSTAIGLASYGILPGVGFLFPVFVSFSGLCIGSFLFQVTRSAWANSFRSIADCATQNGGDTRLKEIGRWSRILAGVAFVMALLWLVIPISDSYSQQALQQTTFYAREPLLFPIRLLCVGSLVLFAVLVSVCSLLAKDWEGRGKVSIGKEVLKGRETDNSDAGGEATT